MGATSSCSAHEGFVVAVPSELYASVIDGVRRKGAVTCDITGRLSFVPPELYPLYAHVTGVPRMYLRVEELRVDTNLGEEPFFATGAVTVRIPESPDLVGAPHHERENLGAAFVTFRTGDASHVRVASEWLDEVYVHGVMDGTVITDFDEQVPRFPGATFSLDAVFTRAVDVSAGGDVLDACRASTAVRTEILSKVSLPGA